MCQIVYFAKSLFAFELPQHRRKQKNEWRWLFNVSAATKEEWDDFTGLASQKLDSALAQDNFSSRSPISYDQRLLNFQWHTFKSTLLQVAHEYAEPLVELLPELARQPQAALEHERLDDVARDVGLRTVGVPVDDDGVRTDGLDALGAAAIVVTPAHQFPTGAVMSPARRTALLAWADCAGERKIEELMDEAFGALQGL